MMIIIFILFQIIYIIQLPKSYSETLKVITDLMALLFSTASDERFFHLLNE